MLTQETVWQKGTQLPPNPKSELRARSIADDPRAAYFSHPEEACRAASLLEMKQVQILIIKN